MADSDKYVTKWREYGKKTVSSKEKEPKKVEKEVFVAVADGNRGHVSFPKKKDAEDYIKNVWGPMGYKGRVVPGKLTWTDPKFTYTTGTGQVLTVHEKAESCENGCVIHRPSGHNMTGFKTHWREDIRMMERICPHGVGHPDPDSINFRRRIGDPRADLAFTHGCDGCCS